MSGRRLIHLALAPLYLAALIVIFSIFSGTPPASALGSGLAAFAMSIAPAALAVLGLRTGNRKCVRASLLAVIVEVLVAGWLLSPGRATDFSESKIARELNAQKTIERLHAASESEFDQVVRDAKVIAEKGARQTGSPGLEQVLQFVQSELSRRGWSQVRTGDPAKLGEPPESKTVRRTEFNVLAPQDEGSKIVIGDKTVTAYALMPNGIQPCATPKDGLTAPLVYLGRGSDEDIEGREPAGKIAVFEFDSLDRWRWAYDRGALGAIFLSSDDGSEQTIRQADAKYLGLLPIYFPRLYVSDASVREEARAGKAATLFSRMTLRTVSAPVLEALIPGTNGAREILIMCHADARSIAPALSFGGQETFGLASWLALVDHFSKSPPAFSLRFVLTTGHWQTQAGGRAYAYAIREAMGERIAMAIGVSLNPESSALIVTDESVAECIRPQQYWWLKKLLFTVDKRDPAWIDQIESISERKVVDRGDTPSKYEFHGGRPTEPGSQWSLWLAPLDQWPQTSHAISIPAANQMITQLGCMSVAFKTCNDYCLRQFTCQDTIDPWLSRTENLKPQLELTFALIGAIADLDPKEFPTFPAVAWHEWEGYNQAEVQVLRWNPSILWYDKTPPENERTFVMLVPGDSRFAPGKNNAVWSRPMAPSRYIHRLLQCQQTVYVSEVDRNGRASFANIYSTGHDVVYNAIALSIDADGHLTHAFDQGLHGDAEFHFLNRKLAGARTLFQIPTFNCGSLVLTSLLNRDRVDISRQAEHEYQHNYSLGTSQDEGEAPFLPVRSVNEAATHTSADSFSWLQYRDTAMVFLKPGQRCEVIAADRKHVLFNDDPKLREELTLEAKREGTSVGALLAKLDAGKSATESVTGDGSGFRDPEYFGFRVTAGEERRIVDTTHESFAQLENITRRRMEQYAALNVKSPSAEQLEERAAAAEKQAQAQRAAGHQAAADAAEAQAWSDQSQAYRATYRLLMDVVTTTIFYFLLLLPFGFLIERLLFPQPTLVRSCVVGAAVFIVFSGLLYIFHPGFHLASNIFVTAVSFVIVILTLPALSIVVFRGAAMLKEPGAKFQRRHRADAERLGVLTSALSLAVNNMRRRRLRTGLTLATITLLVTSLVLLTSTTSDTSFDREKQLMLRVPYRGIQVMNTHNHTHGMNTVTAELLTSRYRDACDIVWRQYFNPGFEYSIPCYGIRRDTPPAPPFQEGENGRRFNISGAIALSPREAAVTKIDKAIVSGRFLADTDRHACLLPDDTARRQRLAVGDSVRFLGVTLELVGILRSTDIDAGIVDLSGRPLTPLAFYRPPLTVDTPDHLLANESIFVPSAFVRDEIPAPFPVFSVVLVPKLPAPDAVERRVTELQKWSAAASSSGMGTAEQRLIAASKGELDAAEAAWLESHGPEVHTIVAAHNVERLTIKRIAEEIAANHENVDVYATQPAPPWENEAADRVELLSAFARVSLQSGSFLVLPFLISFFMLLAIMIGNVYERRSEIQVFSSVGLAPKHVAGMFLAEALVYAGIASVLGYFIGIILLDVFRRAGWLPPDFHANYFGKVVIWSAAMATTSSLLSVLYPMHIASRMVNPSLERVWRIESIPVGNNWRIPLPFVAHDREEAVGILQFAGEFISHHRGERTGAFAVEEDPALENRDMLPVLKGTVWLSPFERDLVQTIAIVPRRDAEKDRYHFELETTRLSGPDYLWRKSNHAFVDGLRKQILIWRSLDEESIEEYTRAGLAIVDRT